MPTRPRALGLAASLLVATLAGCAREPLPAPPNIIVFVLDTVRADSVELDEAVSPITPNLSGLAREGVAFSAAFTHTTWTKPAIATLFTSQFPTQHTVRIIVSEEDGRLVAGQLPLEVETLAERLQAGGYRTSAIINQVHLQEKFGFAQGFDEFHVFRGKLGLDLNEVLRKWVFERGDLGPEESARPVFLYMHYLDPHWPYVEFVEELGDELGPLVMESEPPVNAKGAADWFAEGLTEDALRALETRYRHGVASTDRAMGEALFYLDQAGLLDDAVVVVTSDHGEGFGEHGEFLHGYAPYEEVHRVPLVLRLPERLRDSTREVSALVGLVDIGPTLLELAGLPVGEGMMGRSLVPLMRGADASWRRPVYSETEGIRSLRTPTHKLIVYPDGRREFFDLATDPLEQTDLPCDETCEDLAAQLGRLTDVLERSELRGDSVDLDAEDLKSLEALGYLN